MQCVCKHEEHAEGKPEGERGKKRGCVVVFKGFDKRKRRYSVCKIDVGKVVMGYGHR